MSGRTLHVSQLWWVFTLTARFMVISGVTSFLYVFDQRCDVSLTLDESYKEIQQERLHAVSSLVICRSKQ